MIVGCDLDTQMPVRLVWLAGGYAGMSWLPSSQADWQRERDERIDRPTDRELSDHASHQQGMSEAGDMMYVTETHANIVRGLWQKFEIDQTLT